MFEILGWDEDFQFRCDSDFTVFNGIVFRYLRFSALYYKYLPFLAMYWKPYREIFHEILIIILYLYYGKSDLSSLRVYVPLD